MFLVALSVEIHVEQALCRTGLGAAMLRFCGRVRCVLYILLCVGSLSGLRVVGPVWHYGMNFHTCTCVMFSESDSLCGRHERGVIPVQGMNDQNLSLTVPASYIHRTAEHSSACLGVFYIHAGEHKPVAIISRPLCQCRIQLGTPSTTAVVFVPASERSCVSTPRAVFDRAHHSLRPTVLVLGRCWLPLCICNHTMHRVR